MQTLLTDILPGPGDDPYSLMSRHFLLKASTQAQQQGTHVRMSDETFMEHRAAVYYVLRCQRLSAKIVLTRIGFLRRTVSSIVLSFRKLLRRRNVVLQRVLRLWVQNKRVRTTKKNDTFLQMQIIASAYIHQKKTFVSAQSRAAETNIQRQHVVTGAAAIPLGASAEAVSKLQKEVKIQQKRAFTASKMRGFHFKPDFESLEQHYVESAIKHAVRELSLPQSDDQQTGEAKEGLAIVPVLVEFPRVSEGGIRELVERPQWTTKLERYEEAREYVRLSRGLSDISEIKKSVQLLVSKRPVMLLKTSFGFHDDPGTFFAPRKRQELSPLGGEILDALPKNHNPMASTWQTSSSVVESPRKSPRRGSSPGTEHKMMRHVGMLQSSASTASPRRSSPSAQQRGFVQQSSPRLVTVSKDEERLRTLVNFIYHKTEQDDLAMDLAAKDATKPDIDWEVEEQFARDMMEASPLTKGTTREFGRIYISGVDEHRQPVSCEARQSPDDKPRCSLQERLRMEVMQERADARRVDEYRDLVKTALEQRRRAKLLATKRLHRENLASPVRHLRKIQSANDIQMTKGAVRSTPAKQDDLLFSEAPDEQSDDDNPQLMSASSMVSLEKGGMQSFGREEASLTFNEVVDQTAEFTPVDDQFSAMSLGVTGHEASCVFRPRNSRPLGLNVDELVDVIQKEPPTLEFNNEEERREYSRIVGARGASPLSVTADGAAILRGHARHIRSTSAVAGLKNSIEKQSRSIHERKAKERAFEESVQQAIQNAEEGDRKRREELQRAAAEKEEKTRLGLTRPQRSRKGRPGSPRKRPSSGLGKLAEAPVTGKESSSLLGEPPKILRMFLPDYYFPASTQPTEKGKPPPPRPATSGSVAPQRASMSPSRIKRRPRVIFRKPKDKGQKGADHTALPDGLSKEVFSPIVVNQFVNGMITPHDLMQRMSGDVDAILTLTRSRMETAAEKLDGDIGRLRGHRQDAFDNVARGIDELAQENILSATTSPRHSQQSISPQRRASISAHAS